MLLKVINNPFKKPLQCAIFAKLTIEQSLHVNTDLKREHHGKKTL